MSDVPRNTTDAFQGLFPEGVSGKQTLYVDDEPFMCSVSRRQLKRLIPGTDCVTAENPADAVKKLTDGLAERLCLVMSDIEMPGGTGLDLAESLRNGDAGVKLSDHVPIILTSGNPDYEFPRSEGGARLIRLVEQGIVDAFLPKPYDVDLIRNTVLTAVARRVEVVNALGARRIEELNAKEPQAVE